MRVLFSCAVLAQFGRSARPNHDGNIAVYKISNDKSKPHQNDDSVLIFEQNIDVHITTRDRIAQASRNKNSEGNPCTIFRGRHQSEMENNAQLVIGVVTNKKMAHVNENLHYPFMLDQMSKLPGETRRKVALAYFTNSASPKLPTFTDSDTVSSFATAQLRYLNSIQYMSSCWRGGQLRWFFLMDDDTALSPARLQAFLKMSEVRYGSPNDNAFLFGRRAIWEGLHNIKQDNFTIFGGNGLVFSVGMLHLVRDRVPSAVWSLYAENWHNRNRPWYEMRFFDMIENQNLTSNIYRGPWISRPFGLGLPYCYGVYGVQDELGWYINNSHDSTLISQVSQENMRLVFSLHKAKTEASFDLARQIFSNDNSSGPTAQDYARMPCEVSDCEDCNGLISKNNLTSCSSSFRVQCPQPASWRHSFIINGLDIFAFLLLSGSVLLRYVRSSWPVVTIIGCAYVLGVVSAIVMKYLHHAFPTLFTGNGSATLWYPLFAICTAYLVIQFLRPNYLVEKRALYKYGHWCVIGVCSLIFLLQCSIAFFSFSFVVHILLLSIEIIIFTACIRYVDGVDEVESPRGLGKEVTCFSDGSMQSRLITIRSSKSQ